MLHEDLQIAHAVRVGGAAHQGQVVLLGLHPAARGVDVGQLDLRRLALHHFRHGLQVDARARRLLRRGGRQEAAPPLFPLDAPELAGLSVRREHRALLHRGQLVARLLRLRQHRGVDQDAHVPRARRDRHRRAHRQVEPVPLGLVEVLVAHLQPHRHCILERLLHLDHEGGGLGLARLERPQLGAPLADVDPVLGQVVQRRVRFVGLPGADVLHVDHQLRGLALVALAQQAVVRGHLPGPGEGGPRQLRDVALGVRVLERVGGVVVPLDGDVVAPRGHVAGDLDRHRPGALLAGLELPEDELAPVEHRVVALGPGPQPVDGSRARVVRGDRHLQRAARLRARDADLRLHPGLRLGSGRRRRPVHAHGLERLAHLLLLQAAPLRDERLRLLQLLLAVGRVRLQQEVAAELDLVVELHAVIVGGIVVGAVVLRLLAGLDQLAVLALLGRLLLDEAQALGRLLRDSLAARLGLLLVAGEAVVEVLVVVGLAERLGRREEVDAVLDDARRHQLDVRRDAHFLDGDVARREVLRDGQLQRALLAALAVLEVIEHLHAALPEALPPDDDGAVQVLQRAGHDLARARALRGDEHRHGELALAAVVAGQLGLAQRAVDADGGDDGALLDEGVAHLDGLLQEAAGVAAHVEDEPLERAAVQLLHGADGGHHVAGGGAGKSGEAHVADAVVEQLGSHRLVGHQRAGQVEPPGIAALVRDVDGDLGARLAPHAIDSFLQFHADGGVAVDLRDDVALLHPGLVGRRVLQHFAHRQLVRARRTRRGSAPSSPCRRRA